VHEQFLAFGLGGLHIDPHASSSVLDYGFSSGRELKERGAYGYCGRGVMTNRQQGPTLCGIPLHVI
jgi:hypothetical protein